MEKFTLRVNGEAHEVEADPATPLIFVLRGQLGLTGPKLGCGLEQCGACAILADGERALSCVRAVSEFGDTEITTSEGLSMDPIGGNVQRALIDEGAAQCGYCTPGIAVAATALLRGNRDAGDADIRAALNEHLCRCGSHSRVLKAVRSVAAGGGTNV